MCTDDAFTASQRPISPPASALRTRRCIDAVTHQQATSGGGREGNTGLQLRVVVAARALVGVGPAVIENVFALRVVLQIAGNNADGFSAYSRHQMARPPASAGDRGA